MNLYTELNTSQQGEYKVSKEFCLKSMSGLQTFLQLAEEQKCQ